MSLKSLGEESGRIYSGEAGFGPESGCECLKKVQPPGCTGGLDLIPKSGCAGFQKCFCVISFYRLQALPQVPPVFDPVQG